jgi:hypothetical protein
MKPGDPANSGADVPQGLRKEEEAKRAPPPNGHPEPGLPHDHDREGGQPYAKEAEDYGQGVIKPPAEQTGQGAKPKK